MRYLFFSTLLCFIANAATAAALDSLNNIGFVGREIYGSGVVNILPPADGEYELGTPNRTTGRPEVFLMGKPARQDYVYFSAEEQEGLWRFREAKLDEQRIARERAMREAAHASARRKKPAARLAGLDWPRVIVNGNEVCVPVLDYSDSDDWREHLTCTTPGVQP